MNQIEDLAAQTAWINDLLLVTIWNESVIEEARTELLMLFGSSAKFLFGSFADVEIGSPTTWNRLIYVGMTLLAM